MKFKDYVSTDVKEFTELKIGLVEKSDANTNDELVRKVQKDFDLGTDLIKLKNKLNEKWSPEKGKYLFDYISLEENLNKIDKLKKINKNVKKRMKEEVFKASGVLAKEQTEFERQVLEKH